MSGLTLTLRPREKFLVGGHLVENGPRRSSIRIEDDSVFVLRLSDALHPDDVNTPVTRAYHAAQLILACEVTKDDGKADLLNRLDELLNVFKKTPHEALVMRTKFCVEADRFHGVLVGLKALMAVEDALFKKSAEEPDESDELKQALGTR